MPRLTRHIQAAVRKAQQPGSAGASPLEKIVKQANNELYRQLGIPNAIKLGQSTSGGPNKDRGYAGLAATPGWTGLGVLGQALSKLAWQGGILEVSSPGPQGRDVARQLAAWRASDSRVLWLQLEPAAAAAAAAAAAGPAAPGVAAAAAAAAATSAQAYADSAGSEGPSLTVQRWPVRSPADSRAALQHLVRAVRSQRFSLVVLDCVPALAPPLPGARARAAEGAGLAAAAVAAAATAAAAAPVAPAAAGQAVVEAAAGVAAVVGAGAERAASAAAPAAAARAVHQAAAGQQRARCLGPAAGQPLAAAPLQHSGLVSGAGAEAAAAQVTRREAAALGATGQMLAGGAAGGQLGTVAVPQGPQASAYTPPNYRFLNCELPLLMEQALAALAASCGPELPTTTLLVNCYNRASPQQQGWMDGPGGAAAAPAAAAVAAAVAADSSLADRSRWARRAIARHASGTLHLLPATRAPAGSAAAAAVSLGGAGGPQAADAGADAAADAGAGRAAGGGAAAAGGAGAPAGPPQSLSQLHVEVTRGLPCGDDGAVLFSGWLGAPPPSACEHTAPAQ